MLVLVNYSHAGGLDFVAVVGILLEVLAGVGPGLVSSGAHAPELASASGMRLLA